MNNGNCVEAGNAAAVVVVRDSKLGETSPVLAFSADAWMRFTGMIRG
jgi:hypothetical protein